MSEGVPQEPSSTNKYEEQDRLEAELQELRNKGPEQGQDEENWKAEIKMIEDKINNLSVKIATDMVDDQTKY